MARMIRSPLPGFAAALTACNCAKSARFTDVSTNELGNGVARHASRPGFYAAKRCSTLLFRIARSGDKAHRSGADEHRMRGISALEGLYCFRPVGRKQLEHAWNIHHGLADAGGGVTIDMTCTFDLGIPNSNAVSEPRDSQTPGANLSCGGHLAEIECYGEPSGNCFVRDSQRSGIGLKIRNRSRASAAVSGLVVFCHDDAATTS
jgi:hypothetical protein